jgi:sulfite reductase (ferredoxin)
MVNSAKALLLSKDHSTNTQASIINQFDEVFVSTNMISLGATFAELTYQINKNEPSESFAKNYINTANQFLTTLKEFRKNDLDT